MLKCLCVVVMFAGLLELSLAQRPSFAGLRPPGGLSQKDKYHAAQNTAVENITGVDIATRFGEEAVGQQTQIINLAYGAPQRPPVGVPLVLPISSYVSVVPSTASTGSVDVANRFGGASNSLNTPVPTRSPVFGPSVASVASNAPAFNGLPVDAHGDREYVNHLSRLPVDNQPFWFLNYQAIEALRNSTRPNVSALETRGSSFAG